MVKGIPAVYEYKTKETVNLFDKMAPPRTKQD